MTSARARTAARVVFWTGAALLLVLPFAVAGAFEQALT